MDQGSAAPVSPDLPQGRLREQEQFREAQNLQAAGRVAGSVAQELNDLLTVITGRSQMLLGHLSQGGALRREIELIERAAQRAATLVGKMLAFSWRQALARQVVDAGLAVSRLETPLRALVGDGVEIVVARAAEPCPVRVAPEQIEHVLVALASNARDAMPRGGRLTVDVGVVILDEPRSRAGGALRPGRYVSIGVSDTGAGMDEATRERAVEPFFTTKDATTASGLGLSTVHGIVRQSGGEVRIASEPGRGTTVTVLLPWADESAETDASGPPAESHEPTPGASETVLLAEDEDEVRELTADILARAGYTVIPAANGTLALERARRHKGPLHVLVTDLVMPSMNGRELARRLKLLRPDMRVLYVSGFVRDDAARAAIAGEDAAFLPKPFTPTALVAAVSGLLVPRR